MSLAPGTHLGPYHVVEKLGEGGMGQVYRARDTRLGRDVAIKVLRAPFTSEPDRLRRFQQEARAVAALNDPGICQIHDVAGFGDGGPADFPYLVLEFVNGRPINGPMSAARAAQVGLQIARALATAHNHGVLHRDLKPANILLTQDGRIKLLDFGIAKAMAGDANRDETATAAGTVIGTAAYMSPEQAYGHPVDQRSDIFSFGAVLYELLAGVGPFHRDTAAETLVAVARDEPRRLDTTAALGRIVTRALSKRPADRFQTAGELVAALEALVSDADETAAQSKRPSIAVLPFENLSGQRDHEHFGDGLTEEIINVIARIPGLKVIARTSAFAFKGRHEDVRRIADALGVATVLEGSVRTSGSRIRVTAQLIAAGDGSHLWSERYDRELTDVFAVQDEIAAAIARALQPALGTADADRSRRPEFAAYDHYLRGLYELGRATPESMVRAEAHFDRAVAIDPRFAAAHAELGHLSLAKAVFGLEPPRAALAKCRAHVERALAEDPTSSEGHAMLGSVAGLLDYDWPEAERCFQIAVSSGVASPRAYHYYGQYCRLPTRRFADAAKMNEIALESDPFNLEFKRALTLCKIADGRLDEANADLRSVMASDPSHWFPYFLLGLNHGQAGRNSEALELSEQAYRLVPWFKPVVAVRTAMLERMGAITEAAVLKQQLEFGDAYGDPIGPAIYNLLSGNLDAVADWTRRAIEQRQPAVFFFLGVNAQALRETKHWPELCRLMNLPVQA